MSRIFLLIGFGLAVGYHLGFRDAKRNEFDIVHRVVEQTRTAFHAHPANDIDGMMDRMDKKR